VRINQGEQGVQVSNSIYYCSPEQHSYRWLRPAKNAIYVPLEYNYSAIVILDIFAFTFLSFRTTVRNLSFLLSQSSLS